MFWIIARRDTLTLFETGLVWLLLSACAVILGWVLLNLLDPFVGLDPDSLEQISISALNRQLVRELFGAAAVMLLLIAPLLASRLLSGERRDGRYLLLAAAPVSTVEILLGKWLALVLVLLALALLPLLLCLSLLLGAPVDLGLCLSATLGLWLLGCLFAAVGLFAASLSSQPAAAAVIAYGILVLLSVMNRAETAVTGSLGLLDWLSWGPHLFWFLIGVLRLSDLGYFLLLTACFLALAERRLANGRFQ
jgi:ABC-2 type transport system permease protein